jgi:hypothetical protein
VTRTVLDVGVLVVAVRGAQALVSQVPAILEDPTRTFVASVFLRLISPFDCKRCPYIE